MSETVFFAPVSELPNTLPDRTFHISVCLPVTLEVFSESLCGALSRRFKPSELVVVVGPAVDL